MMHSSADLTGGSSSRGVEEKGMQSERRYPGVWYCAAMPAGRRRPPRSLEQHAPDSLRSRAPHPQPSRGGRTSPRPRRRVAALLAGGNQRGSQPPQPSHGSCLQVDPLVEAHWSSTRGWLGHLLDPPGLSP